MSSFNEYYHRNFAKQVRKFRHKAGLTQEDLSELLGKNLKYVGHIERLERFISGNEIPNLLNTLKVQPSDFFNFEEDYIWEDQN